MESSLWFLSRLKCICVIYSTVFRLVQSLGLEKRLLPADGSLVKLENAWKFFLLFVTLIYPRDNHKNVPRLVRLEMRPSVRIKLNEWTMNDRMNRERSCRSAQSNFCLVGSQICATIWVVVFFQCLIQLRKRLKNKLGPFVCSHSEKKNRICTYAYMKLHEINWRESYVKGAEPYFCKLKKENPRKILLWKSQLMRIIAIFCVQLSIEVIIDFI